MRGLQLTLRPTPTPKSPQWYEPDGTILRELGLTKEEVVGKKFAYGKGCETCGHTGFKGRMALFEIMPVSEDLKLRILAQEPTSKLREQAMREGMRSLRLSGLLGIYDGLTTVEEVLRETM
ncbi:MAG: hypothetical protein R3F30_12710 [Planctomycetota bacterium]